MERQVAWYPGHMAKAVRQIREFLRAVDIIVEVVDARIAQNGRNPLLDEMAIKRTRVVALSREDLADPATTKGWLRRLSDEGSPALAVDCRVRGSVARIAVAIRDASRQRQHAAGISRAMIVGVPNSGKSTIVNALLGRAAAKTESRAGVTRHPQWFRLAPNVELMDSPGVLPPKIPDGAAQWKLAICGAVPYERYDPQEVAAAFHNWLVARERRCPTCKPLQPNAAFFDAAASPIITTRRSRTCALSTKALLAEFHWSFQMTPKQRKAKSAYERERRRLHRLHRFEAAARTRGFSFVAGIDEVGRGPLAGPVVAACVVATEPLFIKGLNDSKLVRADLRLEIAEIVKVRAAAWAIGSACVAEIDRLNIYWASVLAMERAIAALPALPEYLITDAVRIRSFAGPQEDRK